MESSRLSARRDLADVAPTIDPASYNAAIDDVVTALINIAANVNGPMPESTWLQVVRWQVGQLRK